MNEYASCGKQDKQNRLLDHGYRHPRGTLVLRLFLSRKCIHTQYSVLSTRLKPGETKKIQGKLSIVPADVAKLARRYEKDFAKK